MRAVTVSEPGGPDVLGWAEVPDPVCGPGRGARRRRRDRGEPRRPDAAAGLLPATEGRQRDPRAGVQRRHQRGRRGRRPAGRSATRCARCSPAAGTPSGSPSRPGSCCPAPAGVELATAAALPEVACTVWSNVFMLAGLRRGDSFLVHGGVQRHRHDGHPAGRPRRRARVHHGGHAGQARRLPGAGRRRGDQLPRRGLRRAGARTRPTARGSTSSSTTWARSTWPGTSTPSPWAAGWSSSACRAAPRPSWTSASCCAKRAAVHATALRSRPATGPGGKAEIVAAVRARRVARRRARRHPPDRRPAAADVPGRRGARASSRRASTSARSCCSPED